MGSLRASFTALLLALSSPLICSQQQNLPQAKGSVSRKWLILPGGATGGSITTQTKESELVGTYGKQNVTAADVDLGEGETEPGTAIFANDPSRHIEILWKDPNARRLPKRVQIWGEKSLWETVHGISLGTTLKTLEQLNRGRFSLAGFAFDYSGTVTSWRQGVLAQELDAPGRVILRLQPASKNSNGIKNSVLGDRNFSSGHPAMQALNPKVYQVIWLFP